MASSFAHAVASRDRPRSGLLAALLVLAVFPASASALDGALTVAASRAGSLRLTHEDGGTVTIEVAAGTTDIGSLPSGRYDAVYRPETGSGPASGRAEARGGETASAPGARDRLAEAEFSTVVDIHAGARTMLEVRPEDGVIREREAAAGPGGATLFVPPELLEALPGMPVEILGGLDTRPRLRPALRLDGFALVPPAGRREVVPASGQSARSAAIVLSPGSPGEARWNLWSGTGDVRPRQSAGWDGQAPPPLHFTLGAEGSATEDGFVTGRGRLDPTSPLGVPLAGQFWFRSGSRENASPRAVGERILPHNDAQDLALVGRLQIGSPFAGTLSGLGPGGHSRASSTGPWGLGVRLAATGTQRNHFAELYRRDLEHAPYEETAFVQAGGDFGVRLGERTCGRLCVEYGSYETSIGDGLFRRDLQAYFTPALNPGADDSGLYWQGAATSQFGEGHVYDYYRWQSSRELRAAGAVDWVRDWSGHVEAAAEARLLTYRRFEHFEPTFGGFTSPDGRLSHALLIGYDAVRGRPADEPFGPGEAFAGRTSLRFERALSARVCLTGSVGGLLFSARDSVLASVRSPYGNGEDFRFEPEDFEAPAWHARPEARIALHRSDAADGARGTGREKWALLYQRALEPPLEALYSPRAFLAQTRPEGIMGNPALEPEIERGLEVGIALPLPLVPWSGRLAVAGYAARVSDALSIEAARVGPWQGVLGTDSLPVYGNGGTLTQVGIHVEAVVGSLEDGLWARLAYDLSRTETDRLEPPTLDAPWLVPDQASGEYESEGYAGPLGGIFDEWTAGFEQGDRTANLDRPHVVSLAVAARPHPLAEGSQWARVLNGWTVGLLGRLESGRPFSQVYVHPAGLAPESIDEERGPDDPAWEEVLPGLERGRMPLRARLDLALTRRFMLGSRALQVGAEALNLLARNNTVAVYRATGEPDEDGCIASCTPSDGVGEIEPGEYRVRLRDPLNYDIPFVVRGWVRLELF